MLASDWSGAQMLASDWSRHLCSGHNPCLLKNPELGLMTRFDEIFERGQKRVTH